MIYVLMKRAAQASLVIAALASLDGGLFAAGPSINSQPQLPITSGNRSVYINGIDISSARSQDLRNVHVKISDTGDVYISAPQYQVTEEETFLPLSTYTSKSPLPEHKAPQAMVTPKPPSDNSERSPAKPNSEPAASRIVPAPATDTSLPAQPASNSAPNSGR